MGISRGTLPLHTRFSPLLAATVATFGASAAQAAKAPGEAAGPPVLVNTTTILDQRFPSVASDAYGNSVIVWNRTQDGGSDGIFGQRFASDGTRRGGEFRVNTWITDGQNNPSVAMATDGSFVVAWTSQGQDGDSAGIYAQRFGSGGIEFDGEFRVNQHTTGAQSAAGVATDADGDFVIAWRDSDRGAVYARRYDSVGGAKGPEFEVAAASFSNHRPLAVAMDPNGDFIVTWSDFGHAGGAGYDVYFKRYTADGTLAQGPQRVNQATDGFQMYPSVAMGGHGAFVFVWRSDGLIMQRRFDANGHPRDDESPVSPMTHSTDPVVAMDFGNRYVVSWQSTDGSDTSGHGVYHRLFSSLGKPSTPPVRSSTTTSGAQANSTIAIDADGDFITAWDSDGEDGSYGGIYARRYGGAEAVDLRASLGDRTDPVAPGPNGRFEYIVDIYNGHGRTSGSGNDAVDLAYGSATGIEASLVLPKGSKVLSLPDECSLLEVPRVELLCRIPLLVSDTHHYYVLKMRAPRSEGLKTAKVSVGARQYDPNPADDSDTEETTVAAP